MVLALFSVIGQGGANQFIAIARRLQQSSPKWSIALAATKDAARMQRSAMISPDGA
jgi:hypothetical protein